MRETHSYPGISVTSDGHVFTHRKRFGLGKGKGGGVRIDKSYSLELKLSPGHGGYLYASVPTVKGQRWLPLHALLTDAFLGPCPDGLEVRHLDGNCRNNSIENLVYGTPKQNAEDRLRCGKAMRGEEHPRSKLTQVQVNEIRRRYVKGKYGAKRLGAEFGVYPSTITAIVQGKRWKRI